MFSKIYFKFPQLIKESNEQVTTVIDLYSREIVGWSMADIMNISCL